jgi:hypothetical protein
MGIGDCYADKDERESRNLKRDRGELVTDAERLAYERGQREMQRRAMLACREPRKYTGGPSANRQVAWRECEVAIRSLPITSAEEKPNES